MLARALRSLVRLYGHPQLFLCCAPNALQGRIQWKLDGRPIDPDTILFLGYEPVVLGVQSDAFTHELALALDGKELAGMRLDRCEEQFGSTCSLYVGSEPYQHFLPRYKDLLDRIRQRVEQGRRSNVATALTTYDMTRIAYAHPRRIALAVVGTSAKCNIFPTDLHGECIAGEYLLSLRSTGRAYAQVKKAGSFVLARMPLSAYREVYGLAPRHMAEPQEAHTLIRLEHHTDAVIPEGALSTSVLQIQDELAFGIHRVLLCRIEGKEHFRTGTELAHVHAAAVHALNRKGYRPEVLYR